MTDIAPKKQVVLPFGDGTVAFNTRDTEVIGVVGIAHAPAVPDLGQCVLEALKSPAGTGPLSHEARGKSKVIIISDDATRPTPVAQIAPLVLLQLAAAGVSDSQITFVMANGTHRAMTEGEIRAKVGPEVVERFTVVNHDHLAGDLVDMGATPSGIPVHVNRVVAEADFVIGIGSIVPHRYCGWSGGAKIVQPGVCGEETTVATHLMITRDSGVRLGNVENVVRHEMEEVARRAGLRFIVNVVLNAAGEVAGVVAGDPVLAHRAGVSKAVEICSTPVQEQAHVVVAGSHPADANFWQAGKALYSADLAVRDGGTIVLVTPAAEGIGEHEEFGNLLSVEYDEIMRRLGNGAINDRLSAAGALAVRLVAQRSRIVLVTDGLSDAEVSAMGFRRYPVSQLQQAIDDATAVYGHGCKMLVMKEAPDILPVVPTK